MAFKGTAVNELFCHGGGEGAQMGIDKLCGLGGGLLLLTRIALVDSRNCVKP